MEEEITTWPFWFLSLFFSVSNWQIFAIFLKEKSGAIKAKQSGAEQGQTQVRSYSWSWSRSSSFSLLPGGWVVGLKQNKCHLNSSWSWSWALQSMMWNWHQMCASNWRFTNKQIINKAHFNILCLYQVIAETIFLARVIKRTLLVGCNCSAWLRLKLNTKIGTRNS